MKKAIYCYNIDDVDQHILETITAPMNIELGLLDDGMLKMTVEEILQRQPASNQDCTRFDISFMLMDELSDEEMKQILSAGEQAHWHFDPIKMCLTVGFLALFMLLVFYFPEKRPEPKEREQVKKTKRKKGELRL